MNHPELSRLTLAVEAGVLTVTLNRPDAANALDDALWQELRQAMQWADDENTVRVVVLAGAGRHFCAGIDLAMFASLGQRIADADEGRKREKLRRLIVDLQDCLSSVERCRKPVLAAIHGACLGGGLALAVCCDMRYVSADAQLSVKEIDLGMVADVGTLQRLPTLIPDGLARELAYTGRALSGEEAVACGLANRLYPDQATLLSEVTALARQIATKSPLAVRGTKEVLNYGREHGVADGLAYVASWNAAMLLSADLMEAGKAAREKRAPGFAD